MSDIIHHYTSIDALASILKNRKLRFNRLDNIDDISEGEIFTPYDFSKFLFVSCWTTKEKEDIPQWFMYTNKMKGIRISIPKLKLFDFKHERPNLVRNQFVFNKEVKSAIPTELALTKDYYVLESNLKENDLGNTVVYSDDPLTEHNDDIIQHNFKQKKGPKFERSFTVNSNALKKMVKSSYWEFQKEFRFTIFLVPLPEIDRFNKENDYMHQLMSNIINSVDPKINYLDIELSSEAFEHLKVTLGPMSTEGDKLVVENLIEKYAPKAKLEISDLKGKIKI